MRALVAVPKSCLGAPRRWRRFGKRSIPSTALDLSLSLLLFFFFFFLASLVARARAKIQSWNDFPADEPARFVVGWPTTCLRFAKRLISWSWKRSLSIVLQLRSRRKQELIVCARVLQFSSQRAQLLFSCDGEPEDGGGLTCARSDFSIEVVAFGGLRGSPVGDY